MILESVRAEGLRTLKINEPLDLGEGLTIIKGRNESGKSTLIEVVLFGLYGNHGVFGALRRARRMRLEDAVNFNARRAHVEVVYRVGEKRYRVYRVIERRRDGSAGQVSARLEDLTGNKVIATGINPVNREVERLLGLSWKEMISTNIVAQKDLDRLMDMNKGEREEIINMMMGLESYNKAKDALMERRRDVKKELDIANEKLGSKKEKLRELEELKEKLNGWISERSQIEAKLPEKEKELEEYAKLKEYLSALLEYLRKKKELEGKHEELNIRLKDHRGQIEKDREGIKEKEREREELNEDIKRAKEEREELNKSYVSFESTYRKLEPLKEKVEYIKTQYIKASSLLGDKNEELKGINDRIKAKEEERRKIKAPRSMLIASVILIISGILALPLFGPLFGGVTMSVGAAVGVSAYILKRFKEKEIPGEIKSYLGRKGEIESEIEKLRGELNRLKGDLERELGIIPPKYRPPEGSDVLEVASGLESTLEGLKDQLRGIGEELTGIETSIKKDSQAVAGIEADLTRLRKDISFLIEKVKDEDGELEKVEKELSGLLPPRKTVDIQGLDEVGTEDIPRVKGLFDDHAEKYDRLNGEVARLRQCLEDLNKNIKDAEEKVKNIDSIRQEVKSLRRQVKELRLDILALERAMGLLDSISIARRKEFAPSVEEYMSEVISGITEGKYKAVKIDPETYDVSMFNSEAGQFVRRDIYSGGTNDQLLLAMRIGFTLALLPNAKGNYPKFLFLDEPLGSSDEERRERILELLSKKLTKYFKQIFLITHVNIREIPGATIITLKNGEVTEVTRVENGVDNDGI